MIRSCRIGLVHTSLALFALAVIGKAAHVQLVHGSAWRARAEGEHFRQRKEPAPRGAILDATGMALAQSRNLVRLDIAPEEVTQPGRLRHALLSVGVPGDWVVKALDASRRWVMLPGRYAATDVVPATSLKGVYPTAMSVRSYASSEGTRRIVGRLDALGAPVDGIEMALDSVLRGSAGATIVMRDVRGRSFESPASPGLPPRPGNTVVLTLNHELQEIAERSLDDAVAKMGAEGGDIVVLDPHSGEVLAMAGRRSDPRSTAATALTEPFEPGSTIKPFIAAGLLTRDRVTERDSVDTGNGTLQVNGREIHDLHRIGRAPLADVLRWSSNVGIVKFAARLTPGEEFETLRDFGFGTVTGVSYPSESNGTLREPGKWSQQSAASLAIGYEVAVTPLQLATAYAAFANGGELVAPTLVKEIRAPDGTVLYRHARRVVRRVMSPRVANRVRTMLLNVVENGTALQADLSNYLLAGKTGTPRRTVNGRYATLQYNPNFVGLFPGDSPQYVIVVKLTNPRGTYFGGTTAAPLTKAVLQAAIAARDAALNREMLARSVVRAGAVGRATTRVLALQEAAESTSRNGVVPPPRSDDATIPYVVTLPAKTRQGVVAPPRIVPDVRGLTLRGAVRSLHSAGFRVQLVRGQSGVTTPPPGTIAAPGRLVRLLFDF